MSSSVMECAPAPVRPAHAARLKPVHVSLVFGEQSHLSVFLPLLQKRLGGHTHEMSLTCLPSKATDIGAFSKGFDTLRRLVTKKASPDVEAIVFCKDMPPTATCVEAALSTFGDRLSVFIVETDKESLFHEIGATKAMRRQIDASLDEYRKSAHDLLAKANELQRKHPRAVTVLDHRKSVDAQAKYAHFKIGIQAHRKIPAMS